MMNPTILYEVKSLSNLVGRQIDRALSLDSGDNPTGMQGFVLGYLGGNRDKDVFQRDVETEFQIRRSTATGILQLMEKGGLIERRPVAYDARLKKLVLTEKASRSYENVMRIIHSIDELAESGLTKSEIETFLNVLHKMQKNLEQGVSQ
ncbi:MarR family winged helix-turn-helix transcriptional regulator [Lachnospiraceae bacterium ZAX-1]